MQCISPLYIRKANQYVPCGKCNFCLQKKRTDWTFRLLQEQKLAFTEMFLTLTYADDKLPINPESGLPTLRSRDLQLFTKRLRKEQAYINPHPLRYYSVGEYGARFMRPHYHSILFNLDLSLWDKVEDIWGNGRIKILPVETGSIHYVTKYVINRTADYSGREPPRSFMSKRPGIGANYLGTHTHWHKEGKRNYTQVNGVMARLPRYYKEKIFSKLDRQLMSIQAIEESERLTVEELERLSKLHHDPANHYDERVRYAHESIHSKINSNDTF